jgi:hypothetical protein
LLQQLQHLQLASDIEDSDYGSYDEVDFQVAYRRPELVHHKQQLDGDLSEHIKFRLWLARQLALAKHQEKWGG